MGIFSMLEGEPMFNIAEIGMPYIDSYTGKGMVDAAKKMASIEEGNLARENAVFAYQKDLQHSMNLREDTSVQRRIKDLEAAGLSPVLAAGQGARAGNIVPVKAPQQGTQAQQQKAQVSEYMMKVGADISKTLAETDLIKAQKKDVTLGTENKIMNNKVLRETMQFKIEEAMHVRYTAEFKSKIASLDWQMKDIDHSYYNEYERLVKGYIDENKISKLNPYVIEYATKGFMMAIKDYDVKLYESLGAGKEGIGSLLKILQILGGVVK